MSIRRLKHPPLLSSLSRNMRNSITSGVRYRLHELAVGIWRDAMRYSITLGAQHQCHPAAGISRDAMRCCNFRRALLRILTGHAHGHSTNVTTTYVKSFDHDEVGMKSRIPNMNSTNRMASTPNKGLSYHCYEIGGNEEEI